MLLRLLHISLVLGLVGIIPSTSHAQFKNASFALDAGGWITTQPSALSSDGKVLLVDERPLRLDPGFRLGFESNFKMDQDHWWFSTRLNVGFLQPPGGGETSTESKYDLAAKNAIGTLMAIQASIGVRYYLATNYLRPYLQGSLSYIRLQTFKSEGSCSVDPGVICDAARTNVENFLAHPNVGAFHLQPGFEWVFTKDIALNLFADFQRWLIFNADDNNSVVLGIGLSFYT